MMSKSADYDSIREFFAEGPGRKWWQELHGLNGNEDSSHKSVSGARAELRRCRTPDEVFLVPYFHRLRWSWLQLGGGSDYALATVAGLLAHVESDLAESIGTTMGTAAEHSDRAKLSGLRFRRLIQNESRDELYEPLRRVIQLLGKKASVTDLAMDIVFWGPRTRRKWATDYYQKAQNEI